MFCMGARDAPTTTLTTPLAYLLCGAVSRRLSGLPARSNRWMVHLADASVSEIKKLANRGGLAAVRHWQSPRGHSAAREDVATRDTSLGDDERSGLLLRAGREARGGIAAPEAGDRGGPRLPPRNPTAAATGRPRSNHQVLRIEPQSIARRRCSSATSSKTTAMSQHPWTTSSELRRDVLGEARTSRVLVDWGEAMRAPLPDGWEQHEDESRGKPYYVNEDTGETQWTHPSDDSIEKFQRLRRQRRPSFPPGPGLPTAGGAGRPPRRRPRHTCPGAWPGAVAFAAARPGAGAPVAPRAAPLAVAPVPADRAARRLHKDGGPRPRASKARPRAPRPGGRRPRSPSPRGRQRSPSPRPINNAGRRRQGE